MIRATLLFLSLVAPALASTQDQPVVSVEMEENTTVVGQPLIVRIKVLVPTFSPTPPEFPSLEIPGLLVRLPERASGPISESVDGETWSGVQRAYRLYPLQPGAFEIPAQSVRVTYAERGGIEPIAVELETETIRFDATVPPEAQGLSPLIIARGFTLSQTIDTPETVEVGGAVERSVEARIEGTTPILIPALLPTEAPDGLRVYPKEPKVTENEDRGVLSGQRVDAATYLAVAPGEITLPEIILDWYNLETGEIETARVDGVTISVTGNLPATVAGEPGWTGIGLAILAVIAAGLVVAKLRPTLRSVVLNLRQRWQDSEVFACRRVLDAMTRRELSATLDALRDWSDHFPEVPDSELAALMTDLGRSRYGSFKAPADAVLWNSVRGRFRKIRRDRFSMRRRRRHESSLPPLNPSR